MMSLGSSFVRGLPAFSDWNALIYQRIKRIDDFASLLVVEANGGDLLRARVVRAGPTH